MSKMRVSLALSLILGACAAGLSAGEPAAGRAVEAELDVLVNAIRSNRKAMVAVNLRLTDEEAARFWPLYDRYQKEINAVGDRWLAVIEDYVASFHDLSNDKAMKLVEDYLAVEADRIQVRRTYVPEFAAILQGRKVARLYQIENKMDAVVRYDLAATIPVMEEGSGARR
jgi:hypothetical protein